MNPSFLIAAAAVAASGVLFLASLVRRHRSIADWAFVAAAGLLLGESACSAISITADDAPTLLLWQQSRLYFSSLLPAPFLLFSLTYARGNAQVFLRRFRIPLLIAVALPIACIAIARGQLLVLTSNSSAGASLTLGTPGTLAYVVMLIGSVAVLMNLERTFRASVGTLRWRIKFMLLGVGVLFVVRMYTSSQVLLFRGYGPQLETLTSLGTFIAIVVILRGFLRGRHFQTEVYPSQSVLGGSLTVLLAGIYLISVGALAKVASMLGGDASFALKAFVVLVSIVGLATLLQSDRVRLKLRRLVSRHFQRPLYDYRAVWKQFTAATSTCMEQTDLCRSIVKLSADLFQTLSVTLWLPGENQNTFAPLASTSTSENSANQPPPSPAETAAVKEYFAQHPEPVEFEASTATWAVALRRWQPRQFAEGGNRVAVPLVRHGSVVGILIVGDRVSGEPFSDQDFDLLKCIADQTTASLVNVQLSQKLVQAKELEAFQTMAAFFVHDLKNSASTLNLMLQNLPVHFADPAFREDALRGMGKAVAHINSLVGRLGQLRYRLELRPIPSSLNDVVQATLKGFPGKPGIAIKADLAPELPQIPLDREQLHKVILNLLLNATEAAQGEGEIQVLTSRANENVTLTVVDDGCGMTPEFLQTGLFRPFKTTKKTGLGIGMFQSKMIVDAHGGNIVVTSAPGQGARFEIHLPVCGHQN